MTQARLIEIFESFQGEGTYLGVPMIFVRFQNCALSCQYCDTPDSFRELPEFRLENSSVRGQFEKRPNPIGAEALNEILKTFSSSKIALTGGEPLQHGDFLAHWLPEYRAYSSKVLQKKPWILLETNGVLPAELKKVLASIDVISMDIKLPSTTGMKEYWAEHDAFLQVAQESSQELYVKLVVGEKTSSDEIARALQLVQSYRPQASVILQPVTLKNKEEKKLSSEKLWQLYQSAEEILPQVRIIPQMHPVLGIL